MSFPYGETRPSAKEGRPRRDFYLPPHSRNDRFSNFQNAGPVNHFAGGSGSGRGGRRGRGGGFGGRGWSSGFHSGSDDTFQNPYPNSRSRTNTDPFYVAEKLAELEVSQERVGVEGINFDAYDDIPVETSGSDVPPPANAFEDIDLGKGLADNIKRCKYSKPTPVQRHAIPISIAGRDLMACAQTGSGKTAAFCFPIISGILKGQFSSEPRSLRAAHPLALILSPTRELSSQIHDEAKKFAHQTGVKIVVAYGGAPIVNQLQNLERGVHILVATPGRLVDMIERARVSLKMIKYLALDEADRMLDMGFEPQIRRIVEQMGMPRPGERQTMLFSATFPDEIQKLAADFLSNYIFLAVGRVGSSTDLIAQRIDFVADADKRRHLMGLLSEHGGSGRSHKPPPLTLVFVETKRGADALEHWLSMNGFPATAIHGDKAQRERERALKSFRCGSTPILVATDVAARGLDIPHVYHVINFDLPRDIDDYVHRIGRTGRAGNSGMATAFFSDKNLPLARPLAELMQEAKQEAPPWLIQCAERPSHGGGSGRARRPGGGPRFGGRDFRSRAPPRGEEVGFHHSSPYQEAAGSYGSASVGYWPDDGPIIASGWD